MFAKVTRGRSNSLSQVGRALVTGMSGTGKSTALVELGRRGFQVVDTDEPPWSERSDSLSFLSSEHGPTLYMSETVSNQGRFYSWFDAVVLLSAPAEVLLRRIESRTTNGYGKTIEERRLVLSHLAEVEPAFRATCTHEIDATQTIGEVIAELVEIGAYALSSHETAELACASVLSPRCDRRLGSPNRAPSTPATRRPPSRAPGCRSSRRPPGRRRSPRACRSGAASSWPRSRRPG